MTRNKTHETAGANRAETTVHPTVRAAFHRHFGGERGNRTPARTEVSH